MTKRESVLQAELRPFLPAYATLLLFSLFMPLLYMSAPLYMYQLMDRVMLSRNVVTLWALFGMTVIAMIMYAALDYIRTKTLLAIGAALDRKLTAAVFSALHRPVEARAHGASLADINTVRDFVSGPMVGAIFDAIWSPVFIIVMFLLHPAFGVAAIILVLVAVALALLNHFLVADANQNSFECQILANEFGSTVFRNSEAVRALGMLPATRDRWYSIHRAALGWYVKAADRNNVIARAVSFLRMGQIVVVYTIGTLLFFENELSPSSLMFGTIVMLRGVGPIDYIVASWKQFSGFLDSFKRLDQLLMRDLVASKLVEYPRPAGPLDVNRIVGTGPGSDRIVVNDVSFSVAPGRILGVIGQSGAGKSCLARYVVNAWQPKGGSVALDGHLLSHWDGDQLGQYIGYAPQDVELIPGTVGENISRFVSNASAESVLAAVEFVGLQDLIRSLPQGLATRVGPGGHVLSGGQRQRISLARAFYGNPHLMVLDEPTSFLDAAAEQELGQALQRHRATDGIAIVITHKLSLLAWCDDVLVMHAGVVQAFGSRQQIVDKLTRLKATPALTVIEGDSEGRRAK